MVKSNIYHLFAIVLVLYTLVLCFQQSNLRCLSKLSFKSERNRQTKNVWVGLHADEWIWPFIGTYKAYDYEKECSSSTHIASKRLAIAQSFLVWGESQSQTIDYILVFFMQNVNMTLVCLYNYNFNIKTIASQQNLWRSF